MKRARRPDDAVSAHRDGLGVRRPITVLLVTTISLTLLAQLVSLYLGWNVMPAKLFELVLLLGVATSLAARAGGREGVRSLYRPLRRWRIGVPSFLLVIAAMPVATLAVGAATGTLRETDGGWVRVALVYLLFVAFGALTANLWEETVWGGFVQACLMARHGLLVGSLLTAVPFFVIHLPLAFEVDGWPGTSWRDAFLTWGILLVSAPFFRYLIGMVLIDTSSVLAIGVLHASFNASGALPGLSGGWQYVPAMIALTLAVAANRRRQGKSLVKDGPQGVMPGGALPVEQPIHRPPDGLTDAPAATTRGTQS